MDKNILLVGGGGHCKSVLDSLFRLNGFSKIGIIDRKENIGKCILGVPIIGTDDDLYNLFMNGYKDAFVTVGSVGVPNLRIKLFNKLNDIGFNIPNIIDSTAIIGSSVNMDDGIFIGKRAIINASSIIGKGSIINSGAIIEHDCIIGEFVHIAPGAVLCGEVRIGNKTHIGANSVIKQQLNVGENSIIGIGSVVLKNIEDNIISYGNPCREGKKI